MVTRVGKVGHTLSFPFTECLTHLFVLAYTRPRMQARHGVAPFGFRETRCLEALQT